MELHTKSSWQHPSPLQLLSILPWFLYLWSHLTTGVSEGPFIPLFICPSLVFLFLSPYFLGFSHHVLELVLHPYDQLTFPSNSRRFVPSLCLTPLFIRIFTCIFSNSWQWSRLGLVSSFAYAKHTPTSRPLHLLLSLFGTLFPFICIAGFLASFMSLSNVRENFLTTPFKTATQTTSDSCIPCSLSLPYSSP